MCPAGQFFTSVSRVVWRISIIGNAAVLKTAGLTPLGVRVPHPPHEHIFSGEVVRLSRVRTAARVAMIDHQVNPKGEAQSAESIPLYEGEGKQCTSTVFIE